MRFEGVKEDSLIGDDFDMTLLPRVLGRDESTGKPEYLFGMKINQQLAAKLTGKTALMSGRNKLFDFSMVETIYDAVGAHNTGYGEDESEDKMDLLTQALANLATTTSELENKIRVDHTWKNKSRVSCLTIKTNSDLDDRVDEFEDTYPALQERMSELIQETLIAFGLDEDRAVHEAEGSTYYRLGDDTLKRYISWHKFLQGTVATHGWEEAKIFIKDVSHKLVSFRKLYSTKLQCLARTYTYFRDLQDERWIDKRMMNKRISRALATSKKSSTDSGDKSKNSGGPNPCGHCGIIIHFGGSSNCPWKKLTKTEAKKKAIHEAKNVGRDEE